MPDKSKDMRIAQLERELKKRDKQIESLNDKLSEEKQRGAILRSDLQKKSPPKSGLSKEQKQLLSKLLKDTLSRDS